MFRTTIVIVSIVPGTTSASDTIVTRNTLVVCQVQLFAKRVVTLTLSPAIIDGFGG